MDRLDFLKSSSAALAATAALGTREVEIRIVVATPRTSLVKICHEPGASG
jgi:hypothetical protein